jgi:hypothetical protein
MFAMIGCKKRLRRIADERKDHAGSPEGHFVVKVKNAQPSPIRAIRI